MSGEEYNARDLAEKWSLGLSHHATSSLVSCWEDQVRQGDRSLAFQDWVSEIFGSDGWDRHTVERGIGYSGVFLDFLAPAVGDEGEDRLSFIQKVQALHRVCGEAKLSNGRPPSAQQLVQRAQTVLSSSFPSSLPVLETSTYWTRDRLRKKMTSVLASLPSPKPHRFR